MALTLPQLPRAGGMDRLTLPSFARSGQVTQATDDATFGFAPEDLGLARRWNSVNVLYYGRRGRGKGVTMSAIAKAMQRRILRNGLSGKWKIAANYWLSFADYRDPYLIDWIISFDDRARFLYCCLDELQEAMPSVRAMSTTNLSAGTFLRQIRKRYCEIGAATQWPQDLDRKGLRQMDLFVEVDIQRCRDCDCPVCADDKRRRCIAVDLYISDYGGQWTGKWWDKKFPPYRDEADWLRRLHHVEEIFPQFDTDQMIPPMFKHTQRLARDELIAQSWAGHEQDIAQAERSWTQPEPEAAAAADARDGLAVELTLDEALAHLYGEEPFKVGEAMTLAKSLEPSLTTHEQLRAWLEQRGFETWKAHDKGQPWMARKTAGGGI